MGVVGRLSWNAGMLARRVGARLVLPPGSSAWLRLRLAPPLDELPLASAFAPHGPSLPLLELLALLDAVAEDARVDGVLLELAGGVRGFAQAVAIFLTRLRNPSAVQPEESG